MEKISLSDQIALVTEMKQQGLFFHKFWGLSEVYLTDKYQEPSVSYKNNEIRFIFNKEMWETVPLKFKLFVICHEQLHIMLDHYQRLDFNPKDEELQIKSIASDIAVNHHLIRNYDFDRDRDLPGWENFYWIDTVFPPPMAAQIPDNETVEYYYNLLKQNGGGDGDQQQQMDDHSQSCQIPPDILDEIAKQVDDLTDQFASQEPGQEGEGNLPSESEVPPQDDSDPEYNDATGRPNPEGMGMGFGEHGNREEVVERPTRNRVSAAAWKAMWKKLPKRACERKMIDHWASSKRRYAMLDTGSLILPGELEVEVPTRTKVNIYLDSSGSCHHLCEEFIDSACNVDDKLYDIKLYGFGMQVYYLGDKPPYRLRGFGEESFPAIARHVERERIGGRDVDAVFVFTDGLSAHGTPKKLQPEKWHWFLTPLEHSGYRYDRKEHIHPQSHIHELKDFGWRAE